jgi:hypothetical protein
MPRTMARSIIRLYDLEGLGLIVEHDWGVFHPNQNLQPELPQHPTHYPFAGFAGRSGVLTWANSD